MNKRQVEWLERHMQEFLENSDSEALNPALCDELLAKRMAQAAGSVYDSCMAGQLFAKKESSL